MSENNNQDLLNDEIWEDLDLLEELVDNISGSSSELEFTKQIMNSSKKSEVFNIDLTNHITQDVSADKYLEVINQTENLVDDSNHSLDLLLDTNDITPSSDEVTLEIPMQEQIVVDEYLNENTSESPEHGLTKTLDMIEIPMLASESVDFENNLDNSYETLTDTSFKELISPLDQMMNEIGFDKEEVKDPVLINMDDLFTDVVVITRKDVLVDNSFDEIVEQKVSVENPIDVEFWISEIKTLKEDVKKLKECNSSNISTLENTQLDKIARLEEENKKLRYLVKMLESKLIR